MLANSTSPIPLFPVSDSVQPLGRGAKLFVGVVMGAGGGAGIGMAVGVGVGVVVGVGVGCWCWG